SARGDVYGVRDRFFSCARRAGQEQRVPAGRLPSNVFPEGADGRAVAEQRTLDAPARIVQEILGDAQLALERRGPLRDSRFEGDVHRLKLVGGASPLFVEA